MQVTTPTDRRTHPALLALSGLAVAALASAALAPAAQADPGKHDRAASTDAVATLHRSIQQYQDVSAALAAGFVPVGDCEESAAGGMGIHYINYGAMVQGSEADPTRPTLLLYGPDGSGGLELLGGEFFQPYAGQPAPTLAGEPFDGPMAGHAPGMPWHYDLHVWTEVANPAGVFQAWNPRVHC